jgi:alkylation response protein AidB-like acyl-CoA dehydrogenase
MDVNLSEEEELLQTTARRVADLVGPAPTSADGWDDTKGWAALSQAGLLTLPLIEPGSATGPGVAAALVAEALAIKPCALPFVGSAVLAPALLVAAGADPGLLDEMAAGERRVAIAMSPDLSAPLLRGDTVVLWDAASASSVVGLGPDGTVVMLEAPAPGCPRSVDLTRTTVLAALVGGQVTEIAGAPSEEGLARWTALALTTLSADLCGLMRGALDLAVGYAKSRVQFGVPIGSFQAVKHMCADMLVHLETGRSAMLYAAWAVDHLPADAALTAARVAKAFTSEAATAVTETCVQVHGGVGMTWENTAHLFLRRALLDRQTLGDETVHLAHLVGGGAR